MPPHCFGKLIPGDVLSASQLRIGFGEPVHRRHVPHDRQGLLKPLQVVRGDEDGGRPTVDCDSHSLVMVVHATNEFGQMRLDVAQRKYSHIQKYDQNSEDYARLSLKK